MQITFNRDYGATARLSQVESRSKSQQNCGKSCASLRDQGLVAEINAKQWRALLFHQRLSLFIAFEDLSERVMLRKRCLGSAFKQVCPIDRDTRLRLSLLVAFEGLSERVMLRKRCLGSAFEQVCPIDRDTR